LKVRPSACGWGLKINNEITTFFILVLCSLPSFSQEKDLPYYLEKAQANSPLLKDLSNQLKTNRLDSLVNKAYYKPQINGNLFTNYAPVVKGFGYDTTLSNGQTVSGLVGVNQRIISKSTRNSQAESFQFDTRRCRAA